MMEAGHCEDCERCAFDPDRLCGQVDHPRCSDCGHCQYRHDHQHVRPERFSGNMAA